MSMSQIFTDPLMFTITIGSIVAFLRKHVFTRLDGKLVIGLSIITGIGLGYSGHLLGYLPYPDWLAYGLAGGFLTSGLVDFLRAILTVFGDVLPSDLKDKIDQFINQYDSENDENQGNDTSSDNKTSSDSTSYKADKGKTQLM